MAKTRKTNIEEIKSQLKSIKTELKDGVFVYTGPMTVNEFATKINKPVSEIITYFFGKGKMININMTLDEEQIAELAMHYGYDFQHETQVDAANFMEEVKIIDEEHDLVEKPPVITIMGHVDHGKTTLIDKIRGTNVVSGEAGGITQHTGAYQVEFNGKYFTFLDTPGHEAFTAMRARGAQVTDIVILVVAADDGVMPQTREAIDHSKAAGVPIIVFVNKIDKPGVDKERIMGSLSEVGIISDKWGGDYQFVFGSALTGDGIKDLFKAISLQAELLELKANPNRQAIGTVVESHLDKGRGSVSTLIVQNGTLHARDFVVAGSKYGRVRSLESANGKTIKLAPPGTPVIITGLNYSPSAGDKFFGFINEKFAKQLAEEKKFTDKQNELKARNTLVIKDGIKVLNLIIKADVQGTAEAVKHALSKVKNDEAQVKIISASAGSITKSDILLAQASNAIIYGFHIRPTGDVKQFAEQEKVIIKPHTIIYKMVEEVQALLKGMMAPKFEEKVIGQARIIKVIFSSKVGNIAGSVVIDGKIKSGSKMRLIRDGKTIHEGRLDSLQVGPNQAKSIDTGREFGTHIKKYNNIKEDDIIETYEDVQIEEE